MSATEIDPDLYEHVTIEPRNRPAWAADISVGDTIAWSLDDGTGGENVVVGFSTEQDYLGLPCIAAIDTDIDLRVDAPAGLTFAVQEPAFEGVVP